MKRTIRATLTAGAVAVAATAGLALATVPASATAHGSASATAASSDSPSSQRSGADTRSPRGQIYMGTYNADQLQQCNSDGNYLVYVAHYQGATGYQCKPVYFMPPNTPQCPTSNPDGCIGTWYDLLLATV